MQGKCLGFFIFLSLSVFSSLAQVPVGQWRVHLPYAYGTTVEKAGSRVYCGTRNGLFYYDTEDNSINTLTKVQGLSDVDITFIKFSPTYQTLIIAYRSGNLDLYKNGRFQSFEAISRSNIPGLKQINHIHLRGRYAYLSTAFGIVEFDLQRSEFRNTFIIGREGSRLPVNALTSDDRYFYAATDSGMLVAELDAPNLSNFNFWVTEPQWGKRRITHIAAWRNAVYTIAADSLYAWDGASWTAQVINAGSNNTSLHAAQNHLLLTNTFRGIAIDTLGTFLYSPPTELTQSPQQTYLEEPQLFYVADGFNGLIRGTFEAEQFLPNGPYTSRALKLSAGRAGPLVAAGSLGEAWFNLYIPDGVFHFKDEQWRNYNSRQTPGLDTTFDYVYAVSHPTEDKIYLLPWGKGVKVMSNGRVIESWDATNSSLEFIPGSINPNTGLGDTRVGGLDFDKSGNIWMSNYGASSPISVRRKDGTWQSFNVGQYTDVNDMLVDDFGNKWARMLTGGAVILNSDNTAFRFIGTAEGQGFLPSPNVNCFAKDQDGAVWLGTNEGPVVFYNPPAIFRGPYSGSRIKVLQEQFVGFLLGQEVINGIAVDGANRKWFATNSGAWLFSSDGQKQIHHFTSENSPLLSDVVMSIAIDPKSGEVFMGTDKGVVSFRGTATAGNETHNNVQVFPNPVRPEFDGLIAISGLFTNAFVKITDVQGNLVYQTRADGGQVTWNGRDYNGRKVNTGVYFVLSSDPLGQDTFAAKILFIN